MVKCRWCEKDLEFPCMNTRDMTDAAIYGNDDCYAALGRAGWGEQGQRYVDLNRQRIAELPPDGAARDPEA